MNELIKNVWAAIRRVSDVEEVKRIVRGDYSSCQGWLLEKQCGIDDEAKFELAIYLTGEFFVTIPDDSVRKWKTVDDVINTMQQLTKRS